MATSKPKPKATQPDIQLLITSKCPSISGRSEIRYSIGILDDTEIYIKLVSSDGGGRIHRSWIPFAEILKLLESHSGGSSFSSAVFDPIFSDYSRNNRGFTLALVLKEKLVVPQEGKHRKYVFSSPTVFLAKVEKLIAAKAAKPSSKRKNKASA